ncbi:MAG: hypothetical protein EAZ84_09845 [Verrucomicrobia bacterium]|nr:MAG: hypothetical protein EAZ84_09845 [Verrucomicrobiota bacterium]
MTWQSLRDHIFELVAGAAILGMGTATVTGVATNARQDAEIERVQSLEPKLDKIIDSQAAISGRLERIEGKLEASK